MMKKLLGIVVLGLLFFNNGYADTKYKILGKGDDFIAIEAFKPTNDEELKNNEFNFQEIREIASKHCKHDKVKYMTTPQKGLTFNGIFYANKNKSYIYEFICNKVDKSKVKKIETNQDKKTLLTKSSNLISTSSYNKKQKKLYTKYMSTPEIELCIRYLNNYGWFDDQTIRYTAIYNRGLNCDKYEKLAIDEEKRRNKIANAGKKLLDGTVDSVSGTTENNSGNKRTHCTTTNIGGTIQVFCREY